MAKKWGSVALIGAAAAGALVLLRKRSSATPITVDFQSVSVPKAQRSLCLKYPSGSWAEDFGGEYTNGSPHGVDYNPSEIDEIRSEAQRQTTPKPRWSNLSHAERIAFGRTIKTISRLCPGIPVLASRTTLDSYRKSNLAFAWLYRTVYDIVWARIVEPIN